MLLLVRSYFQVVLQSTTNTTTNNTPKYEYLNTAEYNHLQNETIYFEVQLQRET